MIFLSYANEDLAKARSIADVLETDGERVWFDKERVGPSSPIAGEIEAGLEAARIVLVLWSRSAAGSAWVQQERDAAIARRLTGDPVRVVMARLYQTDLPPLSAAERHIDLRDPAELETPLAVLTNGASLLVPTTLEARIHEAVIPRRGPLAEVMLYVERGEPVCVLAPRRSGAIEFTRQLQERLATLRPDWDFRAVPAVALVDETVDAYLARMRKLMALDENATRLVLCVDGWSHEASEHQKGGSSRSCPGSAMVRRTSSFQRPTFSCARMCMTRSAFSSIQKMPLPFRRRLMMRRTALSTAPLPRGTRSRRNLS